MTRSGLRRKVNSRMTAPDILAGIKTKGVGRVSFDCGGGDCVFHRLLARTALGVTSMKEGEFYGFSQP
jgi:hypothetical protein